MSPALHPRGQRRAVFALLSLLIGTLWTGPSFSAGITGAEVTEVIIQAGRMALRGSPRAASEGTVLAAQLANRPLLRTGELLEVVPGLVATQHSGDGKANQYFLRGFNLDHGTDFATEVDGVPVNLPTHAHGQGYTDMNFVIPELVERIDYRKGTYYAESGNFSAAGSARIAYRDHLDGPLLSVTTGQGGYRRWLGATAVNGMGGTWLLAAEGLTNRGPWTLPQGLGRHNLMLRFHAGDDTAGARATLTSYGGDWRSTDQIPRRAVLDGRLGRYDTVDDTDGGSSYRHVLSLEAHAPWAGGQWQAKGWAQAYGLGLYSNFTYATRGEGGDQFEQRDRRFAWGAAVDWKRQVDGGAVGHFALQTGAEVRFDRLAPVGLYETQSRQRTSKVREDAVRQSMASGWAKLGITPTSWWRAELGLRADRFGYAVNSSLVDNSGQGSATRWSPKFSMAFGPWCDTEWFVAAGEGFHSNDARGATLRLDPADGVTPALPVTPLAAAYGAEVGVRSAVLPRSQVSFTLWALRMDSELVFVGDGGTTEPSLASERRGVEFSLYSKPFPGWTLDADMALSRARFRGALQGGSHVPGAVEQVGSLGLAYERPARAGGMWFGGVRLRYLGAAALDESGAHRSSPAATFNMQMGRRLGSGWSITAGIFNVFNRQSADITYWYASRLAGEVAPVEDVHFHPAEPRTVRIVLQFGVH